MRQEVLGQPLAHSTGGYNNVLNVFDLFWGEWLCGVDFHPLNSCAILHWCHLVGRVLGNDWFEVLVLHEGFIDIARHVAIDMSLCVVPSDCKKENPSS